MAITPTIVVHRYQSAQYTGTNGQDIADWFGLTLLSEENGVCSLSYGSVPLTFNAGEWAIALGGAQPAWIETWTDADYLARYAPY